MVHPLLTRQAGWIAAALSVPAVLSASPANAAPEIPDTVDVTAVQQDLIRLGGPLTEATGTWDAETAAAWRWFVGKHLWSFRQPVTQKSAAKLDRMAAKVRIPASCKSGGLVLCADAGLQTVRLFRGGKQIAAADAVFGVGNVATRRGVHRIHTKTRFLISNLSGTPMPYSVFFSRGQALHYSKAFQRRGYKVGTLGCIAVGDKKFAKYAYHNLKIGGRVIVY